MHMDIMKLFKALHITDFIFFIIKVTTKQYAAHFRAHQCTKGLKKKKSPQAVRLCKTCAFISTLFTADNAKRSIRTQIKRSNPVQWHRIRAQTRRNSPNEHLRLCRNSVAGLRIECGLVMRREAPNATLLNCIKEV